MKVGYYVRTINGISKIIKIQDIITSDNEYMTTLITHDNGNCDISNILKSSPNIIDLIEVGDYVNGEKVIALRENINVRDIHINSKEDLIFTDYEIANNWYYGIDTKDIKTIVTKEQFKEMEYKL